MQDTGEGLDSAAGGIELARGGHLADEGAEDSDLLGEAIELGSFGERLEAIAVELSLADAASEMSRKPKRGP